MPTFDWTYKGYDALFLLESKGHPVLNVPSKIRHNGLLDEYQAAAKYGLIPDITMSIPSERNWFCLPRQTRAAMVAQTRLEAIQSGIAQLDSQPYWEKYHEQRRKKK